MPLKRKRAVAVVLAGMMMQGLVFADEAPAVDSAESSHSTESAQPEAPAHAGGHGSDVGHSADQSDAAVAYREVAMAMQHGMGQASSGDPDVDFATGMLAHHEGAVAMAEVELEYGTDPEMRELAQDIIDAQQAEIEQMRAWIEENAPAPGAY